jgi:TfoX/Sxy family transcriptional regulator of competence genes
MHSNPQLVARIRGVIDAQEDHRLEQRVMFGGAAFFLNGNMCMGVYHDLLICRVGPDRAEDLLKREHVRIMDITGRPMKGWIMIEPGAIATAAQLRRWLKHAIDFVGTLPHK